ncbi:MAG: hypothetical protein K2K92_04730, partial [Duncaniella sp.]|nr:hypothetical protein [Duncaniella sp.]
MSKILSFAACLPMLAGALSLSAEETTVTLAEWTFEKAYTEGETVGGKTVYTPTQENQTDIATQWFNT